MTEIISYIFLVKVYFTANFMRRGERVEFCGNLHNPKYPSFILRLMIIRYPQLLCAGLGCKIFRNNFCFL